MAALLGGLSVSTVLFVRARHEENRRIDLVFRRECDTQASAFTSLASAYFGKTRVLGDFLHATPVLDQKSFHAFADGILERRTNLVALEWAPKVKHAERSPFEQRMRQAGHTGYSIKQMMPDCRLVPAPDGPEYYPISLVEPYDSYPHALGVDMGTRPGAAEAMQAAGLSGGMQVSLPTQLLPSADEPTSELRDGILVFMPVYQPGQRTDSPERRWNSLRGFAVGVYSLSGMLDQAVSPFAGGSIPIMHRVLLEDNSGVYRIVAGEPPSPGAASQPEEDQVAALRAGQPYYHAVAFALAGENWLFVSVPNPGSVRAARSWVPFGTFTVGLLFTLAIAAYIRLLLGRAAQVASVVAERTRELNQTNEQLRRENEQRMAAKAELAQALRKERQALEAARRVQEELAISQARYRVMGETVPYGVWLTDADGEPQYFSQSFLDLLNMTFHDTRDFGWAQRLAPEDAEMTVDRFKAAIRNGENLELENRLMTADGLSRVVLMSGRPVRDGAGRITSWVGINLDITQRKQAEEELRQHRDYLEEMVRSRNLELMITNEELRRDIDRRSKAEEALLRLQEGLEEQVRTRTAELAATNRELEAFSYSVSHDLRAPLRHIAGFVQLLQKQAHDRLDEASRRHLQVISTAAARMGQLIDDLLKFSRLGRAAMRFVPVSVAELVQDVHQELTERNGESAEWVIDPALPEVEADPALLRIVLVNLLSNALKYSRTQAHPRIEIGAFEEAGGPGLVTLYIRDNGVGFDMQYANRLFGVFQRLHKAEEFEGTGIGLAIVQRIIHRHGGTIRAEASINGGATFYFSLPRSRVLSDAESLEPNTAGRG